MGWTLDSLEEVDVSVEWRLILEHLGRSLHRLPLNLLQRLHRPSKTPGTHQFPNLGLQVLPELAVELAQALGARQARGRAGASPAYLKNRHFHV